MQTPGFPQTLANGVEYTVSNCRVIFRGQCGCQTGTCLIPSLTFPRITYRSHSETSGSLEPIRAEPHELTYSRHTLCIEDCVNPVGGPDTLGFGNSLAEANRRLHSRFSAKSFICSSKTHRSIDMCMDTNAIWVIESESRDIGADLCETISVIHHRDSTFNVIACLPVM
jgi:hypothetical protein